MVSNNKKEDKLQKKHVLAIFNKIIVKQVILAIVFTITMYFIVGSSMAPERVVVKIGDLAPDDIRATKEMIDEIKTDQLKEEAIEKIDTIYSVETSVQVKIKNDINRFFIILKEIRSMEDETHANRMEHFQKRSNINLDIEEYSIALSISDDALGTLENNVQDMVSQVMGMGILEEEIESKKISISRSFEELEYLSENVKTLGISIIEKTMQPNKFVDVDTTFQKRQEASDQVAPVVIKEGQIIVEKKQLVDERIFSLVKKTGLLKETEGPDYRLIIGTIIFILILEALIVAYLYIFDK
ncbi:MAG: phosphohydrolase, partial [Tissierellales bacterium]